MKFKFLEHTADVKFQAFGSSLEKAFENAALAMFNHMYDKQVKEKIKKKFKVVGKDFESLLYNFLEELLFLLDSEFFFLSKVKVKIDKKKMELNAQVSGDIVKNYKANADVKAVTYNEMFVKKQGNRFICQVVLDV